METAQAISRLLLKDEDLCGPQHAHKTACTNAGTCTSQCWGGRDGRIPEGLTQPSSLVSELQFQRETRSKKHSAILDL